MCDYYFSYKKKSIYFQSLTDDVKYYTYFFNGFSEVDMTQ